MNNCLTLKLKNNEQYTTLESSHHDLACHLPYYYDLVLVAFSADFRISASAKNPLLDALCRANNGLCDAAFGAEIA